MRTPRHVIVLALTLVALVAAGCSGEDSTEQGGDDTAAIQARLQAAHQAITDAKGLIISLKTTELPSGVTGLLSASGRGYQGATRDDAAFTGDVTVVTGGGSLTAEVVAVAGKVYAKTSLTPVFLAIDPATLKAPDPASLLGAKGDGLPIILTKTDDVAEKGKSRDGKTVLTTVTGTIPGAVIQDFLPTADAEGTFKVTYRLTDDDILTDANITGPFYADGSDVTYAIVLDPTDDATEITKP
ncbi:MAG: LppX_LprAFG lipoprotein [Aeromicrobium sp.]